MKSQKKIKFKTWVRRFCVPIWSSPDNPVVLFDKGRLRPRAFKTPLYAVIVHLFCFDVKGITVNTYLQYTTKISLKPFSVVITTYNVSSG